MLQAGQCPTRRTGARSTQSRAALARNKRNPTAGLWAAAAMTGPRFEVLDIGPLLDECDAQKGARRM